MAQVTNEYAEALFALACEQDARAQYSRSLAMVGQAFEEQPEYLLLLSSPNIDRAERVAILTEAFSGAVPDDLLSFLCILVERGHIRDFAACAAEYERLYQFSERISVAQVTSAVPLTEEQKQALTQKLTRMCAGTVTLSCSVDPALIGGMVVTIDGKVMDGSVKHRLQEIKDVIHR